MSDHVHAHCHVDPSDLTKRSVTHSVSQSVRYVGIELPGQLKIDFLICLGRVTREKDTALSLQKKTLQEWSVDYRESAQVRFLSTLSCACRKIKIRRMFALRSFFAQKNEFLTVQVNLKGIKQGLWIDSNNSIPVSFVHK